MPAYDWTTNNHEGRGLRSAFKRLESKLDSTDDTHELTELIRAMAYVAQIKAGIAKNQELEKRIAELERLAGIAQNTVISK